MKTLDWLSQLSSFSRLRRGHIVCPLCFNEIAVDELLFRCINSDCAGQAPDQIYAKQWEVTSSSSAPKGRVLNPPPFSRKQHLQGVECDTCEVVSRTRICPKCHFELQDPGLIDQRIIAIIGGKNTGKSHYIAVLIKQLQDEIGPDFEFSVVPLGDDTRLRYEREFYTPLYTKGMEIPGTRPAQQDPQVKTPLIFRITFRKKKSSFIYALNLYFFDTAGEDMQSFGNLTVQNRYIIHAHGIILLLDPLQIDSVRNRLPTVPAVKPDPQTTPSYIVDRVRELFERYRNIKPRKKIEVPVAFTLSKIDVLSSLIPRSSSLLDASDHQGQLDLDAVDALSTEIESYLNAWINPTFCSNIDAKFAHYRFFGISSLGSSPVANKRLTVQPRRVEEPFLWILRDFGLIKSRRGR